MNTKLASEKALAVIDRYLHFNFEGTTVSVPYYNNSRTSIRAGLRGTIGKGDPRDILDETEIAMTREKSLNVAGSRDTTLTADTLKHFLVDHKIGIDCSGFVVYVLNAEMSAHGKGSLERHIKFPFSKGILGKIRAKLRPVENADVATLAYDGNSRMLGLADVLPGDIITMLASPEGKERDHVLFIHRADYENSLPTTLYYTHSVAWPSDGRYGHGVRQGTIEIIDAGKPLTEQKWIEAGKTGTENYTFARALKARTEIRRMVSW